MIQLLDKRNRRDQISNQGAFTLIEMLMVILLTGILAAVAIPQFLNFQTEANNSAVQASVGALRTAIVNQKSQMLLRCAAASDAWPILDALNNNDIATIGSICQGQPIPPGEAQFVPIFPANAWGGNAAVVQCAGAGCAGRQAAGYLGCSGAGFGGGWCYDIVTGDIWADSNANGAAIAEHSF